MGLYSVRFARWIGRGGWLYALEPNPICVSFLRANLEHAGTRNFTIVPVAASNARGECAFSLNYGSSMIGVGADSPVAGKPGHQIRVEAERLDSLIAAFDLRQPDFIKVDVEGAEAAVVAGMMETLEPVGLQIGTAARRRRTRFTCSPVSVTGTSVLHGRNLSERRNPARLTAGGLRP